MKVNLITLGCPKNIVDSEILQGGLKACGVEFVPEVQQAQTVIINTCGFIESAKEESINTILEAVQFKQNGQLQHVFVTGCLSERYGTELRREIPEVDGFYGNRDIPKIVAGIARQLRLKYELLGERPERSGLTPRHYAYLKISEGCEHPCTFCAIPAIRGRFRSTLIPDLVNEAWGLAKRGVKELILVAQDSTQYGLDLNGQQQLPDLLHALCNVDGIEWIRLMYAYPYHMTEEIIAAVASEEKIVKYVDMPIQHVSDRLLKRMARRVNRRFTEDLIDRMHRDIPNLVLRTSFIVGFPGETEEDCEELHNFVLEGKIERAGVFTYSNEENTPASRLEPQVPEETKRERYDLLMQAQQQVADAWSAKQIGKELRILVDEFDACENVHRGRTEWDCPEIDHTVLISGNANEVKGGEFLQVQITEARDYDLTGITKCQTEPRSPSARTRVRRILPVLST